MKYLLLLFVFPVLLASDCNKKKKKQTTENKVAVKDSIPVCLRKKIDESNKETPASPPDQIDEYLYNGKTVYLFTAPCCDQFNILYDDSCRMICSPTGGFTGRGDGKCADFSKTAQHVKKIWTNTAK